MSIPLLVKQNIYIKMPPWCYVGTVSSNSNLCTIIIMITVLLYVQKLDNGLAPNRQQAIT